MTKTERLILQGQYALLRAAANRQTIPDEVFDVLALTKAALEGPPKRERVRVRGRDDSQPA